MHFTVEQWQRLFILSGVSAMLSVGASLAMIVSLRAEFRKRVEQLERMIGERSAR